MAEESGSSSLARRLQMRRVNMGMQQSEAAEKQRQKEYGEILVQHIRENGQIICVTDDRAIIENLRTLIAGHLKMPPTSINISNRADLLAKIARQSVDSKKYPLILIEQNLNGRDLTFASRMIKTAFPELRILMLAQETDKNHFVLLHESGVDAFLIKPLDVNGLLEKIALAIKPKEQVERSIEWARTLLNHGEHLRALQIANQALEQQSNSSAILILMGDIFKAMGEFEKATDAYNRASGTSSLYLEPLRKLAEIYGETGNIKKQIEYLEKMDSVSPLNLDRKIQIGELLLKINRPDKARQMFDQAMKISSRQASENVSSVAYRVADLYIESDPEMAAVFLQKGLETRKDFWGHEDLGAFNRLGMLLRRVGKWKAAVDEYKKALTVAPNDDGLYYNMSIAYLEGKSLEEARAMALKALGLNPDLPRKSDRVALNLAKVFMATNDKMHAAPLLRTALEINPANQEAQAMLTSMDAQK